MILFVGITVPVVFHDLGWLPNDDGTLEHAAERVQSGEIPHLDFEEPYTGGLRFLNAAVFSVFGQTVEVLRYPLVALAAVWMWVVYRLAARFLSIAGSALLETEMH